MSPARAAAFLERHMLAVGGALFAALVLPLCGLLFRCGCTFAFFGGATHCNIHHASPPHCPWCEGGTLALVAIVAVVIAAQAGALLLARRRFGRRLVPSALAALAGLVAGTLAAGFVAALIGRYPTFLGLHLF